MSEDTCIVCDAEYRDADERIAARLLCERGYEPACERLN